MKQEIYLNKLCEDDRMELDFFLAEINRHLNLSRRQNELIMKDFMNALEYYLHEGVSFKEGLRRLSADNLGDFYEKNHHYWYPLDNAAKIYPYSLKHDQMPIFRMSVYLKEPVVPEILQMALTFTIKRFPSFATTLKRGFFWHYLDEARRRFAVEKETERPLQPIRIGSSSSQSFKVLYYENRISMEIFHALTDGTGGLVFLKTLTTEYMRLLGHEVVFEEGALNIDEPYKESEIINNFANTELKKGTTGFMGKPARQLKGRVAWVRPSRLLHFTFATDKLKETAHQYGCTITVYVLAQMFMACKEAIAQKDGRITIQVPVNMRKFNKSDTLRNYSMYMSITVNKENMTDLKSLIPELQKQIAFQGSEEEMSRMASTTIKMISPLRFIPLFVKAPITSIVSHYLGDNIFTSCLSNVGAVRVSSTIEPYIDCFDFLLGTSTVNRASCGLVAFGNKAVLSITKITADETFEETLYDLFTADGLEPEVSGSAKE